MAESQREYVHQQIQARIAKLHSAMRWYRRRSYSYQAGSVILAALITVVSGLGHAELFGFPMASIDLVLGAFATVVAGLGMLLSPDQSWHLSAEIHGRLRALQTKFDFLERSPDFNESETAASIFEEYQAILADYNEKWQELRQNSK